MFETFYACFLYVFNVDRKVNEKHLWNNISLYLFFLKRFFTIALS